MAARKAGQKVFDWTKLASNLSEEQRSVVTALRSAHEAQKARTNAYPETPTPLKWDFYKQSIQKPEFVDDLKKQFEALKVPYPKDATSAAIDAEEKEAVKKAQEQVKEAQTRAAQFKVELDKLASMKPFEEMTVEEYLDMYPEVRKQADEDTRNYNWYHVQ